jgi:hypothetical protein
MMMMMMMMMMDDITLRTILLKCLTTAEIQLQASTEVRKRHCTEDVKGMGKGEEYTKNIILKNDMT